jgi:hypothetical protein
MAFLTVPLVAMALVLTDEFTPWLQWHHPNYKFIGPFYQSVTALVFGLAGLRSFDKYVEHKNGNGKKPPDAPP